MLISWNYSACVSIDKLEKDLLRKPPRQRLPICARSMSFGVGVLIRPRHRQGESP